MDILAENAKARMTSESREGIISIRRAGNSEHAKITSLVNAHLKILNL